VYRFVDFKSFADAELDLERPLTLLIGKNGSGKSNAIEGVELLAELAQGRLLHEISDIGRGGAFEVRGGLVGCVREGKEVARLSYRTTVRVPDRALDLEYDVALRAKPEPRIASERLTIGGRIAFATEEGSESLKSGALTVRYASFTQPGTHKKGKFAADRSFLSRYASFGSNEAVPEGNRFVEAVHAFLPVPFVFDPVPRSMRQYERMGARQLARSGANLSAVLYALSRGTKDDKATLTRILSWIKQLPEEPYHSFAFVTTALEDVMFGLKQRRGGPITDARVLSDGTLRCLAVLTAVETAPKDSDVIIEELDNGLHPSRTAIVLGAIRDGSKRRNIHILCTTHNPATLDGLTPEQLKGVVVAFWDKQLGASRLVPLLSLPRSDVLLAHGHLGDLVTRRVIEQYLMPDFEEHAQEDMKAWLKALP